MKSDIQIKSILIIIIIIIINWGKKTSRLPLNSIIIRKSTWTCETWKQDYSQLVKSAQRSAVVHLTTHMVTVLLVMRLLGMMSAGHTSHLPFNKKDNHEDLEMVCSSRWAQDGYTTFALHLAALQPDLSCWKTPGVCVWGSSKYVMIRTENKQPQNT